MPKNSTIAWRWVIALSLATGFLASTAAQDRDDKPNRKQTASGFEVTLLEIKRATERDPLNNVLVYRYGSCPPGAALEGIKALAGNGKDVLVAQVEIRVLNSYREASVALPILLDIDGKKFTSSNTMLSASLSEVLRRIKGKAEQLRCEFPFEIPKGTRLTKLQFDEIAFDLNPSKGP